MTEEKLKEFFTVAEAAIYARVTQNTIYALIQEGRIAATREGRLLVTREAIDEYRANKYSRDHWTLNGEKIHDIGQDRWSVLHTSKVLSTMLRKPISSAYVYYLIRKGRIEAHKAHSAWVLPKSSLQKIYQMKSGHNPNQLTFA